MSGLLAVLHDYERLQDALILGALLFSLGAVGFLARRHLIVSVLSAVSMLQGIVVTLLAFSDFHSHTTGQMFAAYVLLIFAVEGLLAFALLTVIARHESTLDSAQLTSLANRESPGALPEENVRAQSARMAEHPSDAECVRPTATAGISDRSPAVGGGDTDD